MGFKKKGLTWERVTSDAAFVLNIQKSQYGNNVYVNYGIFLLGIEPIKHHSEAHCHIQGRLDDEIGHDYLDFEHPIQVQERIERFIGVIQKNPKRFFSLSGGKAGILQFLQDSEAMMVALKAKTFLGIP